MKKSSIALSLLMFGTFACSQKAIKYNQDNKTENQITEVVYNHYDYVGFGRNPASPNPSGLIKFVEQLGDGGEVKTLKWVNSEEGMARLGLTTKVSSLDDLSMTQRYKTLEEFTHKTSFLAKQFAAYTNLAEDATAYMRGASSAVINSRVATPTKGINMQQMPRIGFDASTDFAIYNVKKSNSAVGIQIENFGKNIFVQAKTRPELKSFGTDLIHSDAVFFQATGERLFSTEFCKSGSEVGFSKSVIPTVSEVTTKVSDDVAVIKNKLGTVSDDVAAERAVLARKSSVPGATCLGSLEAVEILAGSKGATDCPIFGNKVRRGMPNARRNLASFCN